MSKYAIVRPITDPKKNQKGKVDMHSQMIRINGECIILIRKVTRYWFKDSKIK